MAHKRKVFAKREIESFELNADYYAETFANGNKIHVAEELSELLLCSMMVFMRIYTDLPKDVQNFVLNSNFIRDAHMMIIMKFNA